MRQVEDYTNDWVGLRIVVAAKAKVQADKARSIGVQELQVGEHATRRFLENALRGIAPEEATPEGIETAAEMLIEDCIAETPWAQAGMAKDLLKPNRGLTP